MLQNKSDELQLAFHEQNTKLTAFEKEVETIKELNVALQTKFGIVKKSKDEQAEMLQAEIDKLETEINEEKQKSYQLQAVIVAKETEKSDIVQLKNQLEKASKIVGEPSKKTGLFKNKHFNECMNDENQFVSIANVSRLYFINLKLISSGKNLISVKTKKYVFYNIDHAKLNGKILVISSLSFDTETFWAADNQFLQIHHPNFMLLVVGKLICSSNNASEISNLLPYVVGCNLKELYLYNQIITLSEFMKLISSQTLEHLIFYNTIVLNDNGEPMKVKQLRALLLSTCEIAIY